jgi:hypothetical protein
LDVLNRNSLSAEHRFDVLAPGAFLEGRAEYDWMPFAGWVVTLWCEGTWVKVEGDTTVRLVQATEDRSFLSVLGITIIDDTVLTGFSDSGNATGSLNRFTFGGGLAVSVSF